MMRACGTLGAMPTALRGHGCGQRYSAWPRKAVAMAPIPQCTRNGVRRSAFSLLEVVIAMAIFLISMIVLWDIVDGASDMALDVQLQDQANLHCQGKLAEIIVGAEAMASSESFTPLGNAPEGWQWRMESTEVQGITGLYQVKVTVQYERKDGKLVESRLSQMVLDPTLRGSTMDRPTASTTTGTTAP